MLKRLLKNLNVKPEEERQVLLMLGYGFFLGVFIATYQVTADSLFLNRPNANLTQALMIAGGLGVVATAIFSFLQERIRFSTLVIGNLAVIMLLMVGFFLALESGQGGDRLVLFLFCFSGPLTAILLLGYWGIFGRLFNFRQSKRIIGWIDTGQLSAAILASFLVPATSAFIGSTSNYLIVCLIAMVVSTAFLGVIVARYPLAKNSPREIGDPSSKETRFSRIVKDKYVLALMLFLLVSMSTFIFNQYSFQELLKTQYVGRERALTDFLGYFNGTLLAISLIMQTFVNDKILANYGLRTSLLVLPVVIGIFAIGSFASATVATFLGEQPETFVYFFLFVALMRLSSVSLRDSLENPIFKLFFIPLDIRHRFTIQSKVEGQVNEFSRLVAGAAIYGFSLLPVFSVNYIPLFVFIFCVLYFVVVKNLYGGYRDKVRQKLETSEAHSDKLERGFSLVVRKLEQMLTALSSSKAVFSYKLLEKIDPSRSAGWVNDLMRNEAQSARDFAQVRLNEMKGLSVSDKYVVRVNHHDSGDKTVLTKRQLDQILRSGGDVTKSRIQQLTRSASPEDRQYSAELLLHTSAEENTSFLIELLHDPEPKVRLTAIATSIKKNNPEVILALIEQLALPAFSNQAMNALVQIGGKSLALLDSAFYRSGQTVQSMIKIVQTVGRIGGQKAKEILWSKIDFPDKVIVSQVLLALGECGFKAAESQQVRIRYAIDLDIADYSWNLGAIQEVGEAGIGPVVRQAVRWETQGDVDHLFMLLAMIYETRSIQLVKENIESGTPEGVTFAIELLDVFLAEQLKDRVIPVLDDLSDQEKRDRLEALYPRTALDERLVLKFLINRDFTQTNRYTKACVLYQVGLLQVREFELDLIAQIFNPDPLISEVAAWALYQIDPALYEENIARMNEDRRTRMDSVVKLRDQVLLFDRVRFLMEMPVFDGIPGLAVSHLADLTDVLHLTGSQNVVLDDNQNDHFYIVYEGQAIFLEKGEAAGRYQKGDFVGERVGHSGFLHSNILTPDPDVRLLRIGKVQFYEVVAANVKLADRILDYV